MVTIWSWLFRIYNLLKTVPKPKYPIHKEDQVLNYCSTQHKEGLQTRAILRLKDGKIDFLIIVQCSVCASLTVIYGPIVLINRMMIDIEDHQVCLTFSFLWRCFDQFHLTWLTPPVQVLRLVESIIRLFPDETCTIASYVVLGTRWPSVQDPCPTYRKKGTKKRFFYSLLLSKVDMMKWLFCPPCYFHLVHHQPPSQFSTYHHQPGSGNNLWKYVVFLSNVWICQKL